MKFLPYERLKMHSAFNQKEALKRLKDVVEPRRFRFFSAGNTKPYEGKVEGATFDIVRIIKYRNSFLPRITGQVKSAGGGSVIQVTMTPSIFVIVFIVFWLGLIGFFFAAALVAVITTLAQTGTANYAQLQIPGGFFVFGYVLMLGGFKFESAQSKSFLQKLFQAKKVETLGLNAPFERDNDSR